MSTRTLYVHSSPALLRHLARQALVAAPVLTVVPNLAAGRSTRQLTRQALPTITFSQHARRSLARAGWQPLGAAEREERLRALLERLNLEYFSAILERPGTVATLSGVIRALLRSDASRLPAGRSARERDLARLHRSWVLELMRDERYEPAVAEFFASRTALTPQPLVVMGFAYLDAAQLAYLDRLAGNGSAVYLPTAQGPALREAQRTRDALVARGWTLAEVAPPAGHPHRQRLGDAAAQTFLNSAPEPLPDVPVYVFSGVLDEVREVLRQVKRAQQEDARPWHELAVVVRDEGTYLTPLIEVAREYGVPLLSQARLPLSATPLGSLMLAWAEAGLRGWPFPLTRRVLTHPLLHLPFDAGLRVRQFGRQAPGGLQSWDTQATTQAFEWPAEGRGMAYLQHITQALTLGGVLEQQRHQAGLGAALSALNQALQPLEGAPSMPRADFLSALQALVKEASVPVMPGKGGVRVMTPLGTLGRSFRAVWVLGMAQGLFPRVASDPPLLDAHLRVHWSQTGVYLPGGVESQAIEEALFFHTLACARERLTLTRPDIGPGGRALEASAFLRSFQPGQRVREVHAGSDHEAQVHLALLGHLGLEHITAAARREEERERGQASGPELPGVVNPDHWTWSASQLHAYGACRYQWFASKVMHLAPLPLPSSGLEPMSRGTLYHRVLERLLQPWVRQPAPTPDELAERVPEVLDEAVRSLVSEGEIDVGPLWHLERKEHLQQLQRVVRAPEFLPAGNRIEGLEKPLNGQLPVDQTQWTFRGAADRVDLNAEGQKVVTDYKLNRHVSNVRDSNGALGTEVQLPVYLALLTAQAGRYFSLTSAKVLQGAGPGWSGAKYDWAFHRLEVSTFLSGARADLIRGDFRALPDPAAEACAYCDFKPLCRFRPFSILESA